MLFMQSEPMTPLVFARERVSDEELDKFLDRIGRVWRYNIDQGAELRPFNRHLHLNSLEIQFMQSKWGADATMPSESQPKAKKDSDKQKTTIESTTQQPITVSEPSKEMKTKATTKPPSQQAKGQFKITVLDLINYAEMLAATCGLVIMFNWVGFVFSLITNAFYFDSMRTVKKATSWQSAQFALFICFILSVVYAFIHYNTAMKTIDDNIQFDKFYVAVTAAAILSGISWAAIRQSFLKKNEEVDNA